jgi:hypothetical protein
MTPLFHNPRSRPVFGKAVRPDRSLPKSDAAAGMEDRVSPSDPFFAPAAASGADVHPVLKPASDHR